VIYAFGPCELDDRRFELRRDGAAVHVEPQVFDLLLLLVRRRDRVVTKEELLDEIWGDRFVSESTLTSRVKALRRALGDDGRAQAVIRTAHGRGYQFVAPTEEREDTGAAGLAPPRQEVRFARAADGVRLAWSEIGSGPPLVKAANWLSHLDYDAESSIWRHWLRELSDRFRLLRYDERGCGLSDWDVDDFSLEPWVADLETVVDAAGLERFPLLGISQGGPVAITYAVRHPERVSHLVLFGSYAQGRRVRSSTPEARALADARIEMVRVGWARPEPHYRQIVISRFLPGGSQAEWQEFDELQRRSTSAENAWRYLSAFGDLDVVDAAQQVTVPTLVAGGRREPDEHYEQSRLLASLIPGSRLVPLDTANHLLPAYDPAWPTFLAALDDFFADHPVETSGSSH
jgi:DNA-binding winged helix-turn-helix (wHTH) protein/pimeloyl-ACP methyl ester carboxylesterase